MSKMDYLTQCVLAAEAAGMSYGQYMASRPQLTPQQQAMEEDERKCIICGKRLGIDARKGSKYCSRLCAGRANAKVSFEVARAKQGVTPDTERTCPACGKVFKVGLEHAARKYCSPECRGQAPFLSRLRRKGQRKNENGEGEAD